MSEQEDAIRLGLFWIDKICEVFDVDPAETFAHVTASGKGGSKRELARVCLAESIEKMKSAAGDA